MTDDRRSVPVPSAARWLGMLGAVPFVALALALVVGGRDHVPQASFALAAYGAVILSFLGGIQWGMAITGSGAGSSPLLRRLSLSIAPALIAWIAIVLPADFSFAVLALAFCLVLMVDLRAARLAEAPVWYPKLRWPLTVTVVSTLMLGVIS